MPDPSRILIIRPSSLGDVIRTVPALVSLRRAWPQARIDWVVNDSFIPAVQHHPDLSGVIPFPRQALGQSMRRGNVGGILSWATKNLGGYDLAIDLQGLFKSGMLTWGSRASRRVGFADAREAGWLWRPFAYTQQVKIERGRSAHHVERVLALTRAATGAEPVCDLRLHPDPKDRAAVDLDPQLASKRYVLLAPTTRGLGRAWPIDRYAELARRLEAALGGPGIDAVVVTGMASERDYCAPLLSSVPPSFLVDRVGKTSISGLMALIERAALVVCNDSAAMHMAVAFGRPMAALLGASDVGHAGPYRRGADVIQHKNPGERVRHRDVAEAGELMRRIAVEEVFAACVERLK